MRRIGSLNGKSYVHLELPLSVLADTFSNTPHKTKEANLYRGFPPMPTLTSWYRILALSLKPKVAHK